METYRGLQDTQEPNWSGLVDNILGKGTPERVYHIELFQDEEIRDAIADRFELIGGVRKDDPDYERKKYIAVQRFCGFDYVRVGLSVDMPLYSQSVKDTAELARQAGRSFQDEHVGPIMSWEDFEKYPWPDLRAPEATTELEWHQENLPG